MSRAFLFFSGFFVLGLVSGLLMQLPVVFALGFPVVVFMCLVYFRVHWISGIHVFVLPLLAGMVYGSDRPELDPFMNGERITITARVLECREYKGNTLQLRLMVKLIESDEFSLAVPFRSVGWIYAAKEPIPHPGELWRWKEVTMTRIRDSTLEGGFNPARYWRSMGVMTEMRLKQLHSEHVSSPPGYHPTLIWHRFRLRFLMAIRSLHIQPLHQEVIKALTLGDKSGLAPEQRDQFIRAGVAHILAVSGLHVGIVFALVSWLLKASGFGSGRVVHSAIVLLVVWLYTGMTGLGASACRAAGMVTVYEVGRLFRIRMKSFQVIMLTFLIHMVINKWVIFQVSAHLSYLAALGILWFMPRFAGLVPKNRLLGWPVRALLISIAAQIALFPLLIHYFDRFPLLFLAGNLVLVPLWLLIFYLGLAFILLSVFQTGFRLNEWVLDPLMQKALWLTEQAAALPGSSWSPDHFGLITVSAWYVCWLFFGEYLKGRRLSNLYFIFFSLITAGFIKLVAVFLFGSKL